MPQYYTISVGLSVVFNSITTARVARTAFERITHEFSEEVVRLFRGKNIGRLIASSKKEEKDTI